MNKNNIIVFRTDRLGDYIIHSRPIFELKKKIKNSHVIIICSEINRKILNNASYIDELIVYNKNFSILKKLKVFINIFKRKYHSVFVLDGKKFSYFVNIFLRSKKKFGVIYKNKLNLFFFKINVFKPSKIYANFFFSKYEIFTSKKYLTKIEPLQQKYINLFNYYDLKLTVKDKYIFENTSEALRQFIKLKKFYNLNEFILFHFDEKWQDLLNVNNELASAIKHFNEITNKKIIISGYRNNFQYFSNLKKYFPCIDFQYSDIFIEKNKSKDILIFENMNIEIFEQFIKYSKVNISCHSGFVAQVCGANNGSLIDIINKDDLFWYSCWIPLNTNHNFVFKSDLKGKIKILNIFKKIIPILAS